MTNDNERSMPHAQIASGQGNATIRGRARLVWSIALLFVLTNLASGWMLSRIIRMAGEGTLGHSAMPAWGYMVLEVFVCLELATIVIVCKAECLEWGKMRDRTVGKRHGSGMGVGLLCGAVGFTAALPFLMHVEVFSVYGTLMYLGSIGKGLLVVAVVAVALPILCELVFRGMVLGALEGYSGFWPAAFVSALLFAEFWPIQSGGAAVILGLAAAVAYRRSGRIQVAIATNITMTVLSLGLVFARKLIL